MNDTKYDIFISYRRSTGRDAARQLQLALESRGYTVFFDFDSVRHGRFDERILKAIDEAPVFVLLLSEGALDRCCEEGDWVRTEIERALEKGRRIVPVAPSGLKRLFPDRLPETLRNLLKEQVSELNLESLFNESVDKIVRDRFPDDLKGKKISVSGIPSTVRTPSSVFVGREAELGRLHELLSAGKIPIVTGPGGTGKSELVFQYAARFRADYPGGLFQIDAETAKDWNEAYFRMLSQRSQPGVDVRSVLDIPKREEGEEKLCADDVVAALRRRSESSGRILLVLDNVESPCDFLDEETLRLDAKLPPGVSAVVTARNADEFETGERGVVFPLSKLDRKPALDLLCQDRAPDSDFERTAAEDIVERLGRLPLYICRVRALLRKRNGRPSFAVSYSELSAKLRESLPETVDAAMLREEDKRRTPDALWKLTREALSADPSGAAWIKLAHVASFFSPDGINKSIFRHLWGALVAPDTDTDEAFEQALDVLRWHWIFTDASDGLRMHRLIIDALRRSARADDIGLETAVGKCLSAFDGMAPGSWLSFADSALIVSFAPEVVLRTRLPFHHNHGFSVSLQAELLWRNADCGQFCHWEWLDGEDWVELLLKRPQFAECCRWERLDRNNWMDLLVEEPRFSDRCPWKTLSAYNWSRLLASQPQFADKQPPWEILEGHNWSELLAVQPQFAAHCRWEELRGCHWPKLLSEQPQFADRCPWKDLDGGDWAELLAVQPQFADHCSWEKLAGGDWAELLAEQPQFADYCSWDKLNGRCWVFLLRINPKYANHCSWGKLEGDDWAELLGGGDGYLWEALCRMWPPDPHFADPAPNYPEGMPQYAEHCSWDKLDAAEWVWLLATQPQFADHCSWEKLTESWWADLLAMQPQFASRCPWDTLDGKTWEGLLSARPEFADRCPWEKLDGANWAVLLVHQPQFANRCPWNLLDGGDWEWLLGRQPMFAGHCPWKKLSKENWMKLLVSQPQFANRCPWEMLNGHDWVTLLCGFSSGWQARPQFADRCPWEKLSEDDWTRLLREQPQFADKRSQGRKG